MTTLIYVFIIVVAAALIFAFAQALRRVSNQFRQPDMNVPEIPTELPPVEDSPKVFLDPLSMQLHGEDTFAVKLVSPSRIEYRVLVNNSSAKIFLEQGWTPFRQTVKAWINSPAYCRIGMHYSASDEFTGELALAYLYGELLGEAQFEQAFDELEQFWVANAEKFGYEQPKK